MTCQMSVFKNKSPLVWGVGMALREAEQRNLPQGSPTADALLWQPWEQQGNHTRLFLHGKGSRVIWSWQQSSSQPFLALNAFQCLNYLCPLENLPPFALLLDILLPVKSLEDIPFSYHISGDIYVASHIYVRLQSTIPPHVVLSSHRVYAYITFL